MTGTKESSATPIWRFNLRAVLVVVVWVSVTLASLGYLARGGDVPIAFIIYLSIVFVGSAIGTIYGAILKRPERNRWVRALGVGLLFGAIAFVFQFGGASALPTPAVWLTGFAISAVPACLTASLTEVFRILTDRLTG